MKKIIFMLALVLVSSITNAQRDIRYANVVYLSFYPQDLGLGIRYDRKINNFGIYNSIAYGRGNEFFKGRIKYNCGGLIYTKRNVDNDIQFYYGAGLSVSKYFKDERVIQDLPNAATRPISFELTGSTFIKSKFAIGVRYDVLKKEGTMDFGICFGNKKRYKCT
jgi:hypothetical protein